MIAELIRTTGRRVKQAPPLQPMSEDDKLFFQLRRERAAQRDLGK